MVIIKFFIISCSSDAMPEPLFVWGEGGKGSMPTTREETENRITACQEKTKCRNCDAQIHYINLTRSRAAGTEYDKAYSRKIGRPKKTS
jgi:hypothetical protein